MTRLLLVEDDDRLRRALAIALRSKGHEVSESGTVADAIREATTTSFDCAVVDLGLPDGSGVDVISFLRGQSQTMPVIVLSARRESTDKVDALDQGADDYVTKPFGIDELLARIRAGLRRSQRTSGFGLRRTPDFVIDLDRKRVTDPSGIAIRLTPTEWGILECLVKADGQVVAAEALLADVWGARGQDQLNYVRVYIAQLRHKLEPVASEPRYIVTAPGWGYRFIEM
ncbi:MAG: response regulator transcription factor [Candidatus Nanopelagicales bacterium]